MRYKVIRAHTRGGKFYRAGETVEAEADDVKRQLASGALEAPGATGKAVKAEAKSSE